MLGWIWLMGCCLLTHDFSSIQLGTNNEDKLGSVILRHKGEIRAGDLAEWLRACLTCRKPLSSVPTPREEEEGGGRER